MTANPRIFSVGVVSALLAVAVLLGTSRPLWGQEPDRTGAATAASGSASAAQVVVVLKDGTRLEPKTVRRRGTALVLAFADGRMESYDEQDVNLWASRGVPATRRAVARRERPRRTEVGAGSLTSFAAGSSLKLPDPNAAQLADAPARRLDDEEPEAKGKGRAKGERDEETPAAETGALRNDIRDLKDELRRLDAMLAEVRQDCSGNTTATASCGRRSVVSKRHTAACQDAVRRADGKLAPLESRYADLWSSARRYGLEPGAVRSELARTGLDRFRDQLEAVRGRLDALREGS